MRKRCLLGILALSTVAASGQSLEGAKVTRLQGQVQVRDSSVWRLLKEGEQLAESTLLKLAQGSHLSLRYRADGHREEAEGPGEIMVGKGSLGEAKVERYGFKNRALQIPRSGGLDAVGGSVANANPVPTPKPAVPIAPPGSAMAMRLREYPPPPPQSFPVELTWPSAFPRLVDANSREIALGEGKREAVLFEDDQEIGRLELGSNQTLDLADYAADPNRLYRVEFSQGGAMTFRSLEPEEVTELETLQSAVDVRPGERLHRLDRFSALGQYHLAVEEGGRWLHDSSAYSESEKKAAVLQLVYDLNRDMLHNSAQMQYWSDWANEEGVELIR